MEFDFGANIRKIRKAKHLHAVDVIERLKDNGVDIAKTTYYSWEDGTRSVPHKYVIPLCISLGVTVDFLYNVRHDSPMFEEKLKHTEVVKDFLCALDDSICNEIIAISKYWDGNMFTALAFLGTYTAQPKEMRRDVADHCFHNFTCALQDGEAEEHIAECIDIEFCKNELEKLYK